MRHKIAAGLTALGCASAVFAGPVAADPKTEVFPITCDNGRTYSIVTNGNGEFTPGHDAESTATLVPVSFGPFTGTVRDAQGNVVDTFTEPGSAKGQSAKGVKDTVSCTFSFTEVSDGSDPEFPAGYTFSGSGSVTGRVTPSR